MAEVFAVVLECCKRDPKLFWGSLVTLSGLFAMLYGMLWLQAILQGLA
jgi:hypothetical protein